MNDTYLLPDFIGEGSFNLFQNCIQIDTNPIEIEGFSSYTFLRRLDNFGFSMYCVAKIDNNSSCFFYPFRFTSIIPQIESLGFGIQNTNSGKVIYISNSAFDIIDLKDRSILIKSGNWIKDKEKYHLIASFHYLGIIQYLSPILFENFEDLNQYELQLNRLYNTYGDFKTSLPQLYQRIIFSIKFFCITLNLNLEEILPSDRKFCFQPLFNSLKNSNEINFLKEEIYHCHDLDNPFLILNYSLKSIMKLLNRLRYKVKSIDDIEGFFESIHQFQQASNLNLGSCDPLTIKKLLLSDTEKTLEELPIFKMSDININFLKEPEFPLIQPILKQEIDPLAEQVRIEINKSLTSIPDPTIKLQWMKEQIENKNIEYNSQCYELNEKILLIEKKLQTMSNVLKEIVLESQNAANRIESSAKLLSNVHQSHNNIQIKFESLRDNLFTEQNNTKVILVLGILFTIIGAIRYLLK